MRHGAPGHEGEEEAQHVAGEEALDEHQGVEDGIVAMAGPDTEEQPGEHTHEPEQRAEREEQAVGVAPPGGRTRR